MSVAEDFKTLCDNLAVTNRSSRSRAKRTRIVRRLNIEFWASNQTCPIASMLGRMDATQRPEERAMWI